MANTQSKRARYRASEVNRHLFYKFPQFLMLDPKYRCLSANTKLAYMMLLDRHQLSLKNKLIDGNGHIYVIFSREELCMCLNLTDKSVTSIMSTLKSIGLIDEIRRGQGRPNRIYVLMPDDPNFSKEDDIPEDEIQEDEVQQDEIQQDDVDSTIEESPVQTENSMDPNSEKIRIKKETSTGSDFVKNSIPSIYNKTYLNETYKSEGGMGAKPPSEGGEAAPTPPCEKESYGKEFKTIKLYRWELDKLIKMFGEEKVKDYIERVDAHVASTGKNYKCYYATIYKWIKEDERKENTAKKDNLSKPNRFMNFNQRDTDYTQFEKLEREYLKSQLNDAK